MDSPRQLFQHFGGSSTVGPGLLVPVLHLLQHASHADFDEFVQIACGDAKEFHALKQGIRGVASLFEHSLVELQPGIMSI